MATVVTADAPDGQPLSWLARRNHTAWRLGDAPFAARRREDVSAVQMLGASHVHLGLLDAVYRLDAAGRSVYAKNTVGVPVHPDDWRSHKPVVRKTLEQVLHEQAGDDVQVFCPLAVGGHVDHIIVRQVTEDLVEPMRITYYEEYPYADQPAAVQACLKSRGSPDNWHVKTVELTFAEIEVRISAVACYASQIRGLFPSRFDRLREIFLAHLPVASRIMDQPPDLDASRKHLAASMRAYVARVGGERYWQRDGGCPINTL
jgi:LmbE family N-acetylglucosaminyl deacetylase